MKYLLAYLFLFNLDLAVSHSSHHSSGSHSSHSSHVSSHSNHKSYKINKIVPLYLFTLFVFNDFTNSVKNEFEKNEIYRIFNISQIIINTDGDCIYYNSYINKENETLIIGLDNIITNSSYNLDYLDKYCKKYIKNIDILFIFYLILFILFICMCCVFCFDTQTTYNRSSNMY